ncbi:MAG: hypothetical protein ACI8VE_001527, partial [Natrialbaceae archaeon]
EFDHTASMLGFLSLCSVGGFPPLGAILTSTIVIYAWPEPPQIR